MESGGEGSGGVDSEAEAEGETRGVETMLRNESSTITKVVT
jgi:hypothetical protein